MARFIAGAVFGLVVGVGLGAALGLHAEDDVQCCDAWMIVLMLLALAILAGLWLTLPPVLHTP